MTARAVVDASSVPKLAAHRRLQFDKARESWTIQAPERAFMLDEIAHAIVSRCDGNANVAAIVDELCRLYEGAPRDLIETDVLNLVQDFADKGLITL